MCFDSIAWLRLSGWLNCVCVFSLLFVFSVAYSQTSLHFKPVVTNANIKDTNILTEGT